MKRLAALGLFVGLYFALSAMLGQPQTAENLLTNPGFEGEFIAQDGEQPQNVASGWTAWHIPRSEASPSYAYHAPFYDEETVRTRGDTAGKAQVYFNQFATHRGGIYQQVDNLTVGSKYRFSIYAWVWSSIGQDWDTSEQPGNVSVRVGVDPTGGVDATDKGIMWSTIAVFLYNAFYQYSVIAEAESPIITVFVESTIGDPVANNYIYLDDAVLEAVAENGAVEASPTSEAQASMQGDSGGVATPTREVIATVVQLPTESATMDADDTATVEPSATATATHPAVTEVAGQDGAERIPVDFQDTVVHFVVEGDTLSGIALQFDSDIEAIKQLNLLSNSLIVTGQRLVVPVNLPEPTDTPLPADAPTHTATPVTPTATTVPPTATATPEPTSTPLPTATPITHIVQSGDTLLDIATAYGTTVEELVQLNGIQNPHQLVVGLVVLIPTPPPTPLPTATASPQPPSAPVSSGSGPAKYTVQAGDTLDTIARRFGLSVAELIEVNDIDNPSRIFPGQVLQVPGAGGENIDGETATPMPYPTPTPWPTLIPTVYTVRFGDTLYAIAARFGVSAVELATLNNIVNYDRLAVGQALIIPG